MISEITRTIVTVTVVHDVYVFVTLQTAAIDAPVSSPSRRKGERRGEKNQLYLDIRRRGGRWCESMQAIRFSLQRRLK